VILVRIALTIRITGQIAAIVTQQAQTGMLATQMAAQHIPRMVSALSLVRATMRAKRVMMVQITSQTAVLVES
jgi:hypothetical protein